MEDVDVRSLKTLLGEVIATQKKVDIRLSEIEKTLNQLNFAVIGNPTYGQKGMIVELNDVQKYVHRDKMVKAKLMGGLTVIGVLWTMVWEFIKSKIL